jgi:hypothetical protein
MANAFLAGALGGLAQQNDQYKQNDQQLAQLALQYPNANPDQLAQIVRGYTGNSTFGRGNKKVAVAQPPAPKDVYQSLGGTADDGAADQLFTQTLYQLDQAGGDHTTNAAFVAQRVAQLYPNATMWRGHAQQMGLIPQPPQPQGAPAQAAPGAPAPGQAPTAQAPGQIGQAGGPMMANGAPAGAVAYPSQGWMAATGAAAQMPRIPTKPVGALPRVQAALNLQQSGQAQPLPQIPNPPMQNAAMQQPMQAQPQMGMQPQMQGAPGMMSPGGAAPQSPFIPTRASATSAPMITIPGSPMASSPPSIPQAQGSPAISAATPSIPTGPAQITLPKGADFDASGNYTQNGQTYRKQTNADVTGPSVMQLIWGMREAAPLLRANAYAQGVDQRGQYDQGLLQLGLDKNLTSQEKGQVAQLGKIFQNDPNATMSGALTAAGVDPSSPLAQRILGASNGGQATVGEFLGPSLTAAKLGIQQLLAQGKLKLDSADVQQIESKIGTNNANTIDRFMQQIGNLDPKQLPEAVEAFNTQMGTTFSADPANYGPTKTQDAVIQAANARAQSEIENAASTAALVQPKIGLMGAQGAAATQNASSNAVSAGARQTSANNGTTANAQRGSQNTFNDANKIRQQIASNAGAIVTAQTTYSTATDPGIKARLKAQISTLDDNNAQLKTQLATLQQQAANPPAQIPTKTVTVNGSTSRVQDLGQGVTYDPSTHVYYVNGVPQRIAK